MKKQILNPIFPLNEYVPDEMRAKVDQVYRESKMTLEEAKRRYPEWYQRISEGIKPRLVDRKPRPRRIYDWWKRQIESGTTHHHRYFTIMALAIFGVKCGIPFKEVEKDAFALVPFMNKVAPDDPFTRKDVRAALKAYKESYVTFPRGDIEKLTGIQIPPNKRNHRKRQTHMQIARAIQAITDPDGTWRQGNGRKPKADIVRAWRQDHPEGTKADCIRDTGLTRPTVAKWWNDKNE